MGKRERHQRAISSRPLGERDGRRRTGARRWWSGYAPALLLLLALVGGVFTFSHPAAAQSTTVEIADFSYAPATVTISAGESVTWHNGGNFLHSATGDTMGTFDTSILMHGQTSGAITFSTPGTFTYHCSQHGIIMTGTVIVEAPQDGPVLTLTTTGSGSAKANPAGTPTGPTTARYAPGNQVTITATPTGGASFIDWTVDGVTGNTTNPLVLTMDGNHQVVANFTVAPSPNPSPSPSPSPSVAPSPVGSPNPSPSVAPSPSPNPSPSPGASPAPSPSAGPSPSPVPLTVAPVPVDQGTVTVQRTGNQATLTATAADGQLFLGWQVTGSQVAHPQATATFVDSWANPLALTLTQATSVTAAFAPRPAFADVPATDPAAVAIANLAARGVINGCDSTAVPPFFCPADPTLRHQMAALIVRAMVGWADETGLPTFTDNTDDTELMTRVATLQRHGVAQGYQEEVCQARGKTPPCYGPLDTVRYGQTLLFIARAMVAKGYWTLQPDDRTLFPDQNGDSGANPNTDRQTLDHRMVVTYIKYAGVPPDVASATAPFAIVTTTGIKGWGDDAPRAWFARALWQALDAYFGH